MKVTAQKYMMWLIDFNIFHRMVPLGKLYSMTLINLLLKVNYVKL